MSTPQVSRNQLQANADANGNATMRLAGNYELNHNGAYRIFVQLGGILNGVVTVLLDGIPVDGGLTTNLQFKAGPIFVNQNSQLSITVTGMSPLQTASAYLDGIISSDISDFAALGGPGYGGGSVQSDPSQLLVGQVGAPLIENLTVTLPAAGIFFVGDFILSGYGGLLLFGNPPPASTSLLMMLQYEDIAGNQIAVTQIDNVHPKFVVIVANLTPRVVVWINNTDGGAAHNMRGLTIIPIVSIPNDPSRLLPVAFGGIAGQILPFTPPQNVIMLANPTVPFNSSVTSSGTFVWYGKAKLSVFTNSTTYRVQIQTIDTFGTITFLGTWSNQVGGVQPTEVELPPGLCQVVFFNNAGAGQVTPTIVVVASG